MASLSRTISPRFRHRISRHRAPLLLLLLACLTIGGLAPVALQRQTIGAAAPTTARGAPAARATAPEIIAAYHDLQLRWLAAEQALRAGQTENYEIAVHGAEALQARIVALRERQPALTAKDRAIIDAYERVAVQRLAAVQALRARNTENYEIAVSGAEALLSDIVDLKAQRPPK
jgi:hypothetical protein